MKNFMEYLLVGLLAFVHFGTEQGKRLNNTLYEDQGHAFINKVGGLRRRPNAVFVRSQRIVVSHRKSQG